MNELAACPSCKRHVATRETTCPFCRRALPQLYAQYVRLIGRASRAAVFSAALVACSSDDKPKQAPAQGSDDLEKLLEYQPRPVEPVAPPIDAPEAIVVSVDAAVPDAGVDEAEAKRLAAEKKKLADRKRREAERREQEALQRRQDDLERWRMQNAKPYGAPPARRRIV
jgi:hypothetical protein